MSIKTFLWLLSGVLVLGVGLGVVLIVIVPQGGDDGTEEVAQSAPQTSGRQLQEQPAQEGRTAEADGGQLSPTPTPVQEPESQSQESRENGTSGQEGTVSQLSQEDLANLRQRIQSGEATQEDLSTLRQRFQGQFSDGAVPGFPGGLVGTVMSVQGNIVTIETSLGSSQAIIGADANILKTDPGTLEDLTVGVRVMVVGERGADGTLQASSISIIREGSEGFGAGGLAGQQFGLGNQRPFADGPGGGGQAGRPVLTGTVDGVNGNLMTVNTSQGPLPLTIGPDTNIQKSAQGSMEDLQAGVRITVIGQPGENETIQAETVIITPEGLEGFPGGRGLPNRGLGGAQQQP